MLKWRMQFIRSWLKYLLTVEKTTKALLECGVSRAANVAQISHRQFPYQSICNQPFNKAARFISSDIKALNIGLRFSGSFALQPQIRPAMLGSRRLATHTSGKGFDQASCG